jgi:glutathione peroxidase
MPASSSETTAFDFAAKDIDGRERALREFAGQALLIVNVASKCGFTPQYAGLEALWRKRRAEGFAVLGFPCDQFGHQEPGDETEIAAFCERNYGVSFPMFAKIDVNGADAHPLFEWLRGQGGGDIEWNFTKFLVARDGRTVQRYATVVEPAQLTDDIEKALAD